MQPFAIPATNACHRRLRTDPKAPRRRRRRHVAGLLLALFCLLQPLAAHGQSGLFGSEESCTTAADCDDQVFCNGVETCSAGRCLAGAPPCPGAGCSEADRTCIPGGPARLEGGSAKVGELATPILLSHRYRRPVIVATVHGDPGPSALVVRVGDVTGTGFSMRLQSPSGDKVEPAMVSYLVAEEGSWSVDGIAFEARRFRAESTDSQGALVGDLRSFLEPFRQPVVLGQVMSQNDPRWSVFWSAGTSAAGAPAWNALTTGKTTAGDRSFERAAEELGVIVFEAGPGLLAGVAFEAGLTGETISGFDREASRHPYVQPFVATPPVVLASLAGNDPQDIGWAQVASSSSETALAAFVEEAGLNRQARSHGAERVAYVAFERAFQYAGPGVASALPNNIQSEYHTCQVDPASLDCTSSSYLGCLTAEVRGCEAEVDRCSEFTSQVGQGCISCLSPIPSWKKLPILAVLACVPQCGAALEEYILCRHNARRGLRFGQAECACQGCGMPGSTCDNRYGFDISASGLRCHETVTVDVTCGQETLATSVTLLNNLDSQSLPDWCHHTADWEARISAVTDVRSGEELRHCNPRERSGRGLSHGNFPVSFDCSCSGDDCRPNDPSVALFGQITPLPQNAWFKLRTTVEEGCSSQLIDEGSTTVSWDDGSSTFPLGRPENVSGDPGDFVEFEITAQAPGFDCFPNPEFVEVPAGAAGSTTLTTVTCRPCAQGRGADGDDCGSGGIEVPVTVGVNGNVGQRNQGVTFNLVVDGATAGSANAREVGTYPMGTAAAGSSYQVQILDPVVQVRPNVVNECTYRDSYSGTVPESSGSVQLGAISCSTWGQLGGTGPQRPRPQPGGGLDTGSWSSCLPSLFCPPGQISVSTTAPCPPEITCSGDCLCEEITIVSRPCLLQCSGGLTEAYIPRFALSVSGDVGGNNPLVANENLRIHGTVADDVGVQRFVVGINGVFEQEAVVSGTLDDLGVLDVDTRHLPEGSHTLDLVVLDTEGMPNLARVPLQISRSGDPCADDQTAPTVAISTPADGAIVDAGQVDFFAAASDSGSGVKDVKFFVDGAPRHTDTNHPYTWSNWYPNAGEYALRAVAEDHCGNLAEDIHAVTVSDQCSGLAPPTLSLSPFSDGDWIDPGLYHLDAEVTDHSGLGIERVEFQVGTWAAESDTQAPYRSSGYYLVSEGPLAITVRAFDHCGRSTEQFLTVSVSENSSVCQLDAAPPTASILQPTAGQAVTVGELEVVAQVGDDTTLLAGSLEIDGSVPEGFTVVSGNPADYRWTWDAPVGAHTLRVGAVDVCGKTTWSATRQVVVEEQPTCPPDSHTLCLQEGRFQLTMTYDGNRQAKAVPLTAASGGFWFDSPSNLEAMVKVLDGSNGFWTYHGTLTDRSYELTVTDLWENRTETYSKAAGSYCGGGDVSSFPAALAQPVADRLAAPLIASTGGASGTCSPSAHRLCLQGNRFAVTARYQSQGVFRDARAAGFSNTSGTFWFSHGDNRELAIKILDGTSVNQHWWVFHGSTTSLNHEITITDTVTGTTRTYAAPGPFCGGGDIDAF